MSGRPESYVDAAAQATLARIGARTTGITADASKTVAARVLLAKSAQYQRFFNEHGAKP